MAPHPGELDAYSYESHMRAVAAIDEGRFEDEIVPIEVGAAGATVLFAVDETPRRETSIEKMAELQPAFQSDGVVTAANSSSIVDGSAAMLIASEDAVERLGLNRKRVGSRSGSRASTRIGCSTGIPRRVRERSRRPGSRGTTWR